MSWDVCVIKASGYRSIKDLPEDFVQSPMGSMAQVQERLMNTYPNIAWSVPGPNYGLRGFWKDRSEGYSVEFSLGKKDFVDTIILHVRGGGSAVSKIVALCIENGWNAIDASLTEFIDLEQPSSKSWEDFQSYRDRVIKQ